MCMGRYKYFVIDIHGVLIGRDRAPSDISAGEVVMKLRKTGSAIRFLTNSSSVSRAAVVEQLLCAGVAAHNEEVFTTAITTGFYLRGTGVKHRLYVIGSPNLRLEIANICGTQIEWVDPEEAATVIVSRDPRLTEETLGRLGKTPEVFLIATCRDPHFPTRNGVAVGSGPTVERVERALGKTAFVIGKPNPYVLTAVMGIPAEDLGATLVVGDSLAQDVALGRNSGCDTALITTAGTQLAEQPKPDYIIHTFGELLLQAVQPCV